jgi:HAE1 family hydrophobic/amphiphilic exporter-1
VDPVTRTVPFEIALDNTDLSLRPELAVEVDVEGRSIAEVTSAIESRVAAELELPEDMKFLFYGQRKEANESFLSLARAALVAILLIYTILVVRFKSLAQPLLVVLAIPMALIGSVWGLVVTGMPISFTAFPGMIAVTGIVVNDSIVLLDYINMLRARGQNLMEAITLGANTRLRPVLMTSITTIVGLLPLSVRGGDFWGPFGFAMIFGLAASTLLTLLIQPAPYAMLERRIERRATAEGRGENEARVSGWAASPRDSRTHAY